MFKLLSLQASLVTADREIVPFKLNLNCKIENLDKFRRRLKLNFLITWICVAYNIYFRKSY